MAVLSIATGVVIGLAAAFVRWSVWWQHRDMRQWWANVATGVLGLVGAVLLTIVIWRVPRSRLPVAALLVAVAALVAVLVGYHWLVEASIDDR